MAKAKRAPKPPRLTNEQRLLAEQVTGAGLVAVPELRFHPLRRWRIDLAVCRKTDAPDARTIAVEIDGGAWSRGRHVRGAGFIADMEKQNALTELGWRVLRFTPQQVLDGTALAQIRRCL